MHRCETNICILSIKILISAADEKVGLVIKEFCTCQYPENAAERKFEEKKKSRDKSVVCEHVFKENLVKA